MSAVESSSITIAPRKPPERAQEVALNWHDSPFASQFFNALSLVFPTGEQLFIDAIRHYRKEVTDPTLKAQVKGFLAQEALHRKEHLLVNDLLREQGIDPDSYDAFFRENVKMGKKMRSPLTILAMTVACEHFTAILAHRLLSDPDRYLKPMPKELAELWTWHAQEEIEHKAVAFDVYEAMGGGYMRRILIMLEASAMFGGVVAFITGRLLLKSDSSSNGRRGEMPFICSLRAMDSFGVQPGNTLRSSSQPSILGRVMTVICWDPIATRSWFPRYRLLKREYTYADLIRPS